MRLYRRFRPPPCDGGCGGRDTSTVGCAVGSTVGHGDCCCCGCGSCASPLVPGMAPLTRYRRTFCMMGVGYSVYIGMASSTLPGIILSEKASIIIINPSWLMGRKNIWNRKKQWGGPTWLVKPQYAGESEVAPVFCYTYVTIWKFVSWNNLHWFQFGVRVWWCDACQHTSNTWEISLFVRGCFWLAGNPML